MNSKSHKFRKPAEFLAAVCGGLLMSVPAFAQTPVPVTSQPNPGNARVNPCPSIFYEEPHNSRVLVPQGCPPNALTQQLQSQGTIPNNTVPGTVPGTSSQTQTGVGGETPGRTASPRLNPNPGILSEPPYNRSQQNTQTGSYDTNPTPQQVPSTSNPVTEPSLRQQGQSPVATVALLENGNVNIRLINETGANITYQVIGDTNERSLGGQSDTVLQGLRAPVTVTFQREDGGLISVNAQASSETGLLEVRLDETTDVAQDKKAMRIQSNGSVFLN